MIPFLYPKDPFPPLTQAFTEPNGLLAAGGDLTPQRLLSAYRQGIFPWFNDDDPILWWSPDPRMVLYPHELRISRTLQKRLRRQDYTITHNAAFPQVIAACAATPRGPEHPGTWITPEITQAYTQLHQLGYAHSVETWMNDQLVGGLYGIRIGRMYYGESMFHHETDASKIAFVHLVQQLQKQGVGLIDCQMNTPHLATFGAREIPRTQFITHLQQLIKED